MVSKIGRKVVAKSMTCGSVALKFDNPSLAEQLCIFG